MQLRSTKERQFERLQVIGNHWEMLQKMQMENKKSIATEQVMRDPNELW